MTEETIRVGLDFTSDPDPDVQSIQTVTVPSHGDIIRTPHGVYEVDRILFDNINIRMGCVLSAIVSPTQYQIPSTSPKVTK